MLRALDLACRGFLPTQLRAPRPARQPSLPRLREDWRPAGAPADRRPLFGPGAIRRSPAETSTASVPAPFRRHVTRSAGMDGLSAAIVSPMIGGIVGGFSG